MLDLGIVVPEFGDRSVQLEDLYDLQLRRLSGGTI
jgi:hypothetical protein